MIKLSDYVMQFLANEGLNHVFMVVGGGAMHLDDSLGKSSQLTAIPCLHEHAASIAAQAYSRAGGKLGVALVTTGPGGTNAITGVAAAWTDSVPLLIISGQVKRSAMTGSSGLRTRGSQEINIVPVVQSITKYAACVLKPEMIKVHLQNAVKAATSGRPGPAWIDIPLDVQAAMIDENQLEEASAVIEEEYLFNKDEIINLWNSAKRPVIFAGHGIELAKAEEEFHQFKKIVKAPILTTWKSLGLIDEEDECFCGRPGGIAQRGANIVQQKADLLLIIGCRLDGDQVGFNYSQFASGAKKIIVDVDAAELGKLSEMTSIHPIQADAKRFLQGLIDASQMHECDQAWRRQARAIYQKYPVMQPEYRSHSDGVNIYHLVEVLSDLADNEDVIAPGNSAGAPNCTFQAWQVKDGQKFICAAGFGSMGFGIPSAMGAAFANPNRRVICVNGDGGWQLNTQELATIQNHNLNIKFFVLNNNGYASIRNMQRNYFDGRLIGCTPESGLPLPDTLKVAEAYGIKNLFSIKQGSEVRSVVEQVMKITGPVVCEVKITSEQIYAPRLISKIVDGNFVTPTMENLWPEIDDDIEDYCP